MKGLKRASKAAVSLWLSAVMTVLPAAGGMIVPAYGMELTENAGDADTGSFDGYEAAAGGGVVKAVVNGKHEVVSLTIDPEAVDPEDVEMLQDMVVAAVNEAMRKAEAEASQNMSRLTGGLNLGGLF